MPKKRSKASTERVNKNLQKRIHKGKSNASTNPDRKAPGREGGGFMRKKSQIKLLNLYRDKPDIEKMRQAPSKPSRIEPDRKWFGNVRTITQDQLDKYKQELESHKADPYSFALSTEKINLGTFAKSTNYRNNKLINNDSFPSTFGPKKLRIRPQNNFYDIDQFAQQAQEQESKYKRNQDSNLVENKDQIMIKSEAIKYGTAGQSGRIWEELYKVIDSSDIIIFVLDARDPNGTRCYHIEKHLEKYRKLKHIIYVLNKIDLVPTSITTGWVKYLSQFRPTIAFRSSISKPFGKQSLMNLLRQFDGYHKDKKNISIGLIGYPNVGKSSVINTLVERTSCKTAPVPGETKIWQYVSLTNRIYLIDCPGVVFSTENNSNIDIVLKGIIRSEKLEDADMYIDGIVKNSDMPKLLKHYKLKEVKDSEDLITQLANRCGKLLKNGEADTQTISKMIIQDWQTGSIKHYKKPPMIEEERIVD